MSREDLANQLEILNSHTTPPPHVFRGAIKAYEAYVSHLEEALAAEKARVGEEVRFQYSIRDQERQARAEQHERHQQEKKKLVQELGFAGRVYQRVTDAKWHGRKTVKVDALLEGQPVEDAA